MLPSRLQDDAAELCTEAFTHREIFTQTCFHTEKLLHKKVFTQSDFYHTETFTHKSFCIEKAFAQRRLYTK